MTGEQQPPVWLEVAAALLVPSACVGFTRVFADNSAILPIVGAALLSSAVAVLTRRLQLPLVLSIGVSGLLLGALVVNRYAPGTARLGLLPTQATVDQLQLLVDELIRNFQELKSPVPALQPFIAASMVGAWIMAFLTDWGAMRLRLAFEPVLPAGLLFVFTSIPPISAGGNLVAPTILFGLGVAGWAVSQRAASLLQRGVWLAHDHRRGPTSIGTSGAVAAVIAVLAGATLGGRLPGAGADPVYSFQNQGDPTRYVVSPYVDIQSRLVSQTNLELFTVATDEPTYWRIAGLDTYEVKDGQALWKVAGDFSPETGRLPGQRDYGASVDDVTQDFSITALEAIWLPAAFAPSEILEASAEVTWNAENSSLTVSNNVENSDGMEYSIVSKVPQYGLDELQAASEVIPDDVASRYLQLPSNLTPVVAQRATEITAGAVTRYDKAKALQDHFRAYEYSVRLGRRTGDPVEQFLEERQGFCQQFAGTFALMARALGIPTRVATGFTWGDPIGEDPETGRRIYRVTGRQTHAWPEVYFDDLGWVAFEPTPGRGLPGAVNYTGAAARQDSQVQPDNPGGPTTTTTIDPSAATPNTQLGIDELGQPTDAGSLDGAGGDQGGFQVPWRLVVVLGLVAGYIGGIPLYQELRRRRRRELATGPARRTEVAWAEAVEALELGFDLRRHRWETRREFADRLRNDRRIPGEELRSLADRVTVARFHPAGVSELDAENSLHLAKRIASSMRDRVPAHLRLRRQLDPRRLLTPSSRLATNEDAIERADRREVDLDLDLAAKEPIEVGS